MIAPRYRLPSHLAAAIFVLIGGPALVLGVLDALTAPDTEYRVLGVAFALAGANLLGAAACLALPRLAPTWGRTMGLGAAATGVAIGVYLLTTQVGDPQGERFVLWSLVVLASGATVLLLPSPHAPARVVLPGARAALTGADPPSSARQRGRFTRLLASAGISTTFVWGVFQFWYSNGYLPSTVGAALTITAHMQEVGTGGGLVVATADITLRNATNTRVQVVSSLFTISRSLIAAAPSATDGVFGSAEDAALQTPAEALTPYSLASRYARSDPGQVVETGRVVPDDWSFEPGEEYSGRLTAYVPTDPAGQVLHLFVDVVVAKGTHLWLADSPSYGPRLVPSSPYSYEVSEWPIQRLSYIRALTRGDQAATVVVLLGEPAGEAAVEHRRIPALFVCIDQPHRLNDAFARRIELLCPITQRQHDLAVFYGILRAFSAFDLPLPATAA